MKTRLLVDMGNTRIKWVARAGDADIGAGNVDALPALETQWLALSPPAGISVSSVVSDAGNRALADLAERLWGQRPLFAKTRQDSHGVHLAYAEPKKMGVDRWLALIAARHLTADLCMIVDAGTALTVDVLDDSGAHQGGVIAPGLQTMWDSVFSNTHIPPQRPEDYPPFLGNDTSSCIAAGTLMSSRGLLEQLYRRLSDQFGRSPRVIMTGGFSTLMSAALGFPVELKPRLVLDGLALLDVADST